MIYKFKSRASADLIMLGPHGDQMLRLLGREPAAQGIIDVPDMPATLALLQAAITAHDAPPEEGHDTQAEPPVALRQRLWPMIEMLHRAQAADTPVVWGV